MGRKIIKILRVDDSELSKYKVRVGIRGSGMEYTSSFHKTKIGAENAAKKLKDKKIHF